MKLTEDGMRLAGSLKREFRPTTEHGDTIELAHYEAIALAEIIEAFVDAKLRRELEGSEK